MFLTLKKYNYKKYFPYLVSVFILILFPRSVFADTSNTLGSILVSLLSWLFQSFVYIMGNLLVKAIEILIQVASYTDFINSPIVNKGWVVIRDVCNIAITIVLLLMAFYTVLRAKSYQYQTLLPKLLLAAILINFSKTIAGLCIDLAQVFMMTFVNAFREAAAGNLTYGFGINDIISVRNTARGGVGAGAGLESSVDNWSVLGALALGALMVLVAFLVVISLVMMLLWRILYLWFLVMLSPIAFMAGVLPGEGESKVKEWWSTFIKYLIQGPIVAFMLWLSLAVISEMTAEKHIVALQFKSAVSQGNVQASDPSWQAFASKASGTQNLVDYLVTCGLLLLTLKIASQSGVAGASFAGTAFGKLEGAGKWIQRRPQALGRKAWKKTKASYVGQGVTALAQRGSRTWVGRTIGLDKEHTEMQEAKKKARMQEYLGGRKGAIERFEWQKAMKAKKDMEDAGDFKNSKTRKDALGAARDKGDLSRAVAAMMEMAKSQELTAEETKKFFEKFEGTMKTEAGKERLRGYLSTAWDTQEKAGDKSVPLKRNFGINKSGEYVELTEDDRMANVKKGYKNVKTQDLIDGSKLKAMASLPRNNKAVHEFYSMAADRTDLGYLSTTERNQIIDQIDNILADDEANNQTIIGTNEEDSTRRAKMVKLRNELVAMKDAKNYNPQTREIRADVASESDTMGRARVAPGTGSSGFLNASVTNGVGKREDPGYLVNKRKKIITAEAQKDKEERVLGIHEETEVGEAVKKQIIADMDLQPALDLIYEARQEAAKNLTQANTDILKNKVSELVDSIEKKVESSKINLINSDTGQKYAGTELVEEFEKSKMYKAFNDLMYAQGSDVINTTDSIIMDIQDSSNWKKTFKQFLINEEKGYRNTPAARQKVRQKTMKVASKVKTNLGALKGPQHQAAIPNLVGAPTSVQLTTTKEIKRLAKSMRQLGDYAGLINDQTYLNDLNEFDAQFEEYKTKSTDLERTAARTAMETIAKRVLGRFEPLT